MKRVFISQPMAGKPIADILKTRKEAIRKLSVHMGEEPIVIDSILDDTPEKANIPLWCLGKSLELLSTADIAYFAPGWEEARGCRIEHIAAQEYHVQILEEGK